MLSLLEKLRLSVRGIVLSTRDGCLRAQKNAHLHKVKDKKRESVIPKKNCTVDLFYVKDQFPVYGRPM